MSTYLVNGITTVTDTPSVEAVQPVQAARRGQGPEVAGTSAADDDAVSVDTLGAAPPPEVLAEIANASAAYDQLAAADRHVSFSTVPQTGALQIQLQDTDGKVLSALSPSQVLELADGKATDQTRTSSDVDQQRQQPDG